jgi:ribosome assembly protein YihI (activator of Der GTPase)
MPKSRPPRKPKAVREQEKRVKKPKGKPAGSRHNDVSIKKDYRGGQGSKDPRIGSKEPVKLIADPKPKKTQPKKRYATPQKELEAIESDQKLMTLLDKQDNDEALSYTERDYLNTKLDRHKILCDMLGISDDAPEDDDPLTHLDSIKPADYR